MPRFVTALVALAAACWVAGCTSRPEAGFWYADTVTLPAEVSERLNGALTRGELATIEQRSREELRHAFAGLAVTIGSGRHAFWRVEVRESLPPRTGEALPRAGESMAMGAFGGTGTIGLDVVARAAVRFAEPGASRETIIDAIGRGAGRVAVHEFMHQMLGPEGAHNATDAGSYEYGSPERKAQYYGELHWTTAWPALQHRFAKGSGG